MAKFLIISLLFSLSLQARDLEQRRRDYILMKSLINKIEQQDQKIEPELKGIGVVFQSNVIIKKEKNEDGSEKKTYHAFIRNCGEIPLSEKDDEFLKKINNGTRVKIRFSSKCEVSDWKVF